MQVLILQRQIVDNSENVAPIPGPVAVLTLVQPEAEVRSAELLAAHVREIARDCVTNAETLVAFNDLLEDPNAAEFEMEEAALTIQLRAGYDALPEPVKNALNAQILANVQVAANTVATAANNGTPTIGAIAAGTLVMVAVDTNLREIEIAEAASDLYQGLPCVALDHLDGLLAEATTDRERVGVLQAMTCIGEHPLDPDMTGAVIDTRVTAAFMSLEGALRTCSESF